MSGTDRLKLYNGALLLCGERALASLTEEREPRRLLDLVWDKGGVRYCLEQGEWQFAMRTQQIDADPDISPPFGYTNAFTKPDDWVSTCAVCSDERFRTPLLGYADELQNWFADITPIYVKFVSDDTDYGNNLAIWPNSFCDYAEAYFASQIIYKLNADKERVQTLFGRPGDTKGGELGRRRTIAVNRAAKTQPTLIPAQGSWNGARRGRYRGPMGDGGTNGSLIG